MTTNNRQWLKAGSYSTLGFLSQLGFAFVGFLLLVRMMPEHTFGVWVLFLTLTVFADMARTGLVQNAVVKFALEHPADAGRIFATGFWIYTAAGMALGVLQWVGIGWLARIWSAPELVALVGWYFPWALVHGTARYLDFVHTAHNDFKGIFWSKTLYGAAFLLGIVWMWWQGDASLTALAAWQVVAGVPSVLLYVGYRTDYLVWGRYSAHWGRRIFDFGKYVLGTNISSMLFNKMDIMMIGYYLNPAAVAVYNVATRITNYMEVPLSGLSQVVYPRIAMANNTGNPTAVADLYEKSIGLLVAILLPMGLGVWLLADWVVLLVAGKAYLAATPLLQILVLAVMMKPWGRLFGITLDAIGRPRLNFALLALSLLANVVLNALLIPRWGLHGAAAATSASIGLLVVSGQVLMAGILPVQQRRIWQFAWKAYTQPRQLLGAQEKHK